ncbi:Biotin carboxylase [Micromonospora narathiwatensis]|uniref:Biotin carboxylase n=2 Tax=Micromonospora narathiwatensis TaxID=299146 RepID=A0A1A8ZB93_9ACTN|nr:Biotin carboxylase [Micromonospora narathiwatensis]
MALRERAIVAAVRSFPGPIVTIAPAPATRAGKFFDHVIRGVSSDPAGALEAVRGFEKETGCAPAAVVPFIDGVLVAGLTVAEHYGVPYLSRDAVVTSSINKDLMKDRLVAAGLATPRYRRVDSVDAVHAAIAEFGLPCVIKPSAFGGSLGVRLIRAAAEAPAAYEYVRAIIEQTAATFTVKNRSIQVEEFCDLTDEVSVEVLNHRDRRFVLAVVDKSLGPEPYFAEIGHRLPSRYSDRSDVRELALASCAAIGLDRGLAHVEIRLEDGRDPQIIEVGARTAGDGILDLVERALGVSPYELHVRSYLDQLDEPELPGPAAGVAAIATLKARPGRITRIGTPTAVHPAVSSYEVFATPGHVSAAVSANYLTREGYVECFWPDGTPASVPPRAHLDIADQLAAQIFEVTADDTED